MQATSLLGYEQAVDSDNGRHGLSAKNLAAYQQTTDYTVARQHCFLWLNSMDCLRLRKDAITEMRIAQEVGTRDLNSSQPGTKPQEMVAWLEKNGFDVKLEFEDKGDGTALQRLLDNIRQGIPTLVEWIDLSRHWVIAVGYDYRNASDPWDDVLILADPYDKYDDYSDSYSSLNANRFYLMWFDALYFDKITWRTMITATPKEPYRQKSDCKFFCRMISGQTLREDRREGHTSWKDLDPSGWFPKSFLLWLLRYIRR